MSGVGDRKCIKEPYLLPYNKWARKGIPCKRDTAVDDIQLDLILDNVLTGDTHARVKPSGDMFVLTIGRVAPGPMEAETAPQTVVRSKRRERTCDIANKNRNGRNVQKDTAAKTNPGDTFYTTMLSRIESIVAGLSCRISTRRPTVFRTH